MHSHSQPLPHLSMYQITAKLFTHIEQSVIGCLGLSAKPFIVKGVQNFGIDEANYISKRASDEGEHHVLDAYIPSKRMDNIKDTQQLKQQFIQNTDMEQAIYSSMAQLFAHVAKTIVDEYGEAGKNAIREGVRTFGEERGKGIANRAAHLGKQNTIENYLTNYDMGRSELFEYENEYEPEVIEQTFTKCPFGQQWADDDMHEYGILYCEMIDPAIAKGYNPNFEVEHDQYILKEGVCHFKFKLKKEK